MQKNMPSILVDLRWCLEELEKSGLISARDKNLVATTSRKKDQLRLHPLEFIATFGLKRRDTENPLNLGALMVWFAEQTELDLKAIDPLKVDVPAVTAIMSYEYALRHCILAVEVSPDTVVVATDQPFYTDWVSGLAQTVKPKKIERVLVSPAQINRVRPEFYQVTRAIKGAFEDGGKMGSSMEALLQLGDNENPDANDQHIVKIVDWLFQYAFSQGASDIHLEPRRESGNVRFRIDGMLNTVYHMPPAIMQAVVARIKILGRLNVAERRKPQDGRLKTRTPKGLETELRLSTLPTAFGEKLVMRVFDPEVLVRSFEQLGLTGEDLEKWKTMAAHPNGIILVTGPTGSGKTTTLYSTLKQLATEEVNVCTIEDPIEMIEPTFNQMQVQANIDLNFVDGIRSLMRQDPDIIMIGEIRDAETAGMAVQAALTGHLVLSTLHTNDAPSSLTRLHDLGVQPFLTSATILGVMAQRLVRTLCPDCKRQTSVDEGLWEQLVAPWRAPAPKQVFEAVGCDNCRGSGYRGRVGLYEIMVLSTELKRLLADEAPLAQIKAQAYQEGLQPLRVAGAKKVAMGLTTLSEVMRVVPLN